MTEVAPELEHGQEDASDDGAAPRAVLTSKQRKAARERARRRAEKAFEDAEASRIGAELEAQRPREPAAPADAAQPAEAAAAPVVDDAAQLAEAAALFLRGALFPVLAFLASWLTPWTLAYREYSREQAREDGEAWVPVLRRYQRAATVVRFLSPFARLVARVEDLRREKGAPAP